MLAELGRLVWKSILMGIGDNLIATGRQFSVSLAFPPVTLLHEWIPILEISDETNQ